MLKREVDDFSHRIGQEVVDLGGENFESLPQTVSWVRREQVSNTYYLFLDLISLLNVIGASNRLDNDFTDKQYRVAQLNFVNNRATRLLEGNRQPFLVERNLVHQKDDICQLIFFHPSSCTLVSIHLTTSLV